MILSAFDPDVPEPTIHELWDRYAEEIDAVRPLFFSPDDSLPGIFCVYMMFLDGKVAYVGKASNLAYRMRRHYHQWWERLAVVPMPDWWMEQWCDAWLNNMEDMAGAYFKPRMNSAIFQPSRLPRDRKMLDPIWRLFESVSQP